MTADGDEVLTLLLDAADRMGEVMHRLPALLSDEHGISRTRLFAVGRLARCATTQGELAQATSTSPSAASRLVTGMVEDGLVRRVRHRDDRRVVRVELTDDGERLAEELRGATAALFEEVVADVGPARVAEAAGALALLLGALADVIDRHQP